MYQQVVLTQLLSHLPNLRGGTTIVLNALSETVMCIFKNSNWNVIGGNGFVIG